MLITGLGFREMISQCPCGVSEHYQRQKGPWRIWSSLFTPQRKEQRAKEMLLFTPGRGGAKLRPTQNLGIQILRSLNWLSQTLGHTHLVCVWGEGMGGDRR